MKCSVCRTELVEKPHADTVETGVCGDCRTVLGIQPMGEPVRPAVPCMRCNAMQFTRVQPRIYNGPPRPMPITHEPYILSGLFSDTVTGEVKKAFGALEIYICTGCGFIEWYCREPRAIPLGPQYMTDLVDYSPKSEYR
jgi:hypothetical protein